jgi:hypothetical protein
MIKGLSEAQEAPFEGTIIDLETIGAFQNQFDDSRRYQLLQPVIFGYLNDNGLQIHGAETREDIPELCQVMQSIIPTLFTPFYAFNASFESGVIYHACGLARPFDRELNTFPRELKGRTVSQLFIQNYGDPFHDRGDLCQIAWLQGHYTLAIKHNRSCLLKERDILLKRGHRKPDRLIFVDNK